MIEHGKVWVVVLADADGGRLLPLTRALYGDDRPTQFTALVGKLSLLQEAVERGAQLAPLDRILVVVGAAHEAGARAQLDAYPGVDLVVQPKHLDTGPGALLPLARIRAHDLKARVVFMPSQHHIANPDPLTRAIRASAHGESRDRITLFGVRPERAEPEFGWIIRSRPLGRRDKVFLVRSLREQVREEIAERLLARGALWNTSISAGPVQAYWSLARRFMPAQAALFDEYTRHVGGPGERDALATAYATMAPASFSRDLLAHARDLVVMPVEGIGWSDWGSPSRVFRSLEGTPQHHQLVARIATPRHAC